MQTSNVSHNLALVHYGWADFLAKSDTKFSSQIVNKGATYVSFSRSKTIGNTLNITYMGHMPDMYIGDWIVLKTTSKGVFEFQNKNSPDYYLNKGLVRFIGQIHSVTSQYSADADGILRKSYNVLIREWSHCLNLPLRYSDEIALLSQQDTQQSNSLKTLLKNSDSKFIREFIESNWKTYISTLYSSFEIIENILTMMGVRSSLSSEKNELGSNLTTSGLPSIPTDIYDDHIYSFDNEEYEEAFPFNTGFMYQLIGIQKWENAKLNDNLLYAIDFKNIIDKQSARPPSFQSPDIYSRGMVFLDIANQILNTGGEYEIYSDILYFQDANKVACKPVLIVRDKPISFRQLANSSDIENYKTFDKDYGFTYKDDIPRVNIPLKNIISFSISYSIQETYNYIQFMPTAKLLNEIPLMHFAFQNGRYKDFQSQNRFGGQEYIASIAEFVSEVSKPAEQTEDDEKITEQKNKEAPEKKEGTAKNSERSMVPTTNWFQALIEKYKYYLPSKYAMPNCTIQVIDNDFPVSIGLMVRIELGDGRPTLCGQIEEISYTTTINGEGKIGNQTYIKLSDLLMENPQDSDILQIIPKELSRTLFIDINEYNSENAQFLEPRG